MTVGCFQVMTFINTVARIVHNIVTRWQGQNNRNLGNGFLCVWIIGDDARLSALRDMAHLDNSMGPGQQDETSGGSEAKEERGRGSFRDAMDGDQGFQGRSRGRASMVSGMAGTSGRRASTRRSSIKAAAQTVPVLNANDLRRIPGVDELADKALVAVLKVPA